VSVAAKRGYDLSSQRGRALETEDFDEQHLLLALDRSHLIHMQRMCPARHRHKLRLLMEFSESAGGASRANDEVEDPYYDDLPAFEAVLTQIEDACRGIVSAVKTGRLKP
jgi:protein-tyrosine phosphatase